MTTRAFGARIKRNEDPRLLTGQAQFVDDIHLHGMLHAAFKRSDYAHARLLSVDVEAARAMPGVLAVYTADDLGDFWQPSPLLVPPPPAQHVVFNQRTAGQLARDKVRYVGEPIAMVVAESRYLAEDAVDMIEVEYESLPAVVDIETGLSVGAPLVHEDLGSNIAAHVIQEKGDYKVARTEADVLISRRFVYDRGTAAPIEARGVVAHWEPLAHHLTVWDSTQAPIPIRNGLAAMFRLSERQVRVVAPFVGGGFGPKIMMFYPEETLVPWAAMRLNKPVKWIEDRLENFLAMTQERGQVHDSEIALTHDGKIIGVCDRFLHDNGAYDPYGLTVPLNTQTHLLGPYVVPHYYTEFKAIFTNKIIVTPYRGAGRQHGVFVMERLLDIAARQLGIDPIEIRRRNLIPPDAFPWSNHIIAQDFTHLTYDSGNYEPVLDKAREMIGWEDFMSDDGRRTTDDGPHVNSENKEQPSHASRITHHAPESSPSSVVRRPSSATGIGLVMYVEGTGIGPYEGARVQIEPTGKVTVVTGVGTQGQGHYTSFAQIAAEMLGVPVENVLVSTGDTGQFNWGTGTFASRGAVVAGSAVHSAAEMVREKVVRMAAEALETSEANIELVDGFAQVQGVPNARVSLKDLAAKANPLRGAVKPGTEPGLEATAYFGPPMQSTAAGAHAMIVDVDTETFKVEVKRYVVVHDCGRVINPLILEGQVHGGVAQGLGNAFYEQLHYDESGQLLNASFMDYLLPTAGDVPRVEVGHEETPSPLNPIGVKGAGEAGAIPVGPLFAQALEDALRGTGIELEIREIPLSPSRLWELVEEAQKSNADTEPRAKEGFFAEGLT
ncbi:MAG TPA: xanthine dehydrogenase family protein molybdopterin-binding subunit [Chloroflexia bacterium]|nr:xanthine dehydrogenase family protein molybdopterin-binding subunit [Chloroflexia bacterium]